MLFDQLFFRHWDSWKTGKKSHLFIVKILPSKKNSRHVPASDETNTTDNDLDTTIKDVMHSMPDFDCPIPPFGGSEDFVWSPDGKQIAFCTQGVASREKPWHTNTHIYTYDWTLEGFDFDDIV